MSAVGGPRGDIHRGRGRFPGFLAAAGFTLFVSGAVVPICVIPPDRDLRQAFERLRPGMTLQEVEEIWTVVGPLDISDDSLIEEGVDKRRNADDISQGDAYELCIHLRGGMLVATEIYAREDLPASPFDRLVRHLGRLKNWWFPGR